MRDTRQNVTDADIRAVGYTNDCTTRQEVVGRQGRARDIDVVTLGVDQLDHRTQVFTAGRPLFGVEHDYGGQACDLVGLLLHGDAFGEVDETQRTGHFGDNRVGVRIPVSNHLAALDGISIVDMQHGTVRQLVALTLASDLVGDDDLT